VACVTWKEVEVIAGKGECCITVVTRPKNEEHYGRAGTAGM